jgi:trans-aconitate 2-methyltransferase
MGRDVWDPERYARFEGERQRPFLDLLEMVGEWPHARAVDLGCGTGELTAVLHRTTGARSTLGIDRSARMLDGVREHTGDGLAFARADLAALPFAPGATFDLVFSYAALHWVEDHPALLRSLAGRLAPGGVLAVQVPANHEHVS